MPESGAARVATVRAASGNFVIADTLTVKVLELDCVPHLRVIAIAWLILVVRGRHGC